MNESHYVLSFKMKSKSKVLHFLTLSFHSYISLICIYNLCIYISYAKCMKRLHTYLFWKLVFQSMLL